MEQVGATDRLNQGKGKPPGVSIRALSVVMLAATLLSVLIALYELQQTASQARLLYRLEQERQQCDLAIQQLMDGSDFLTSQVQQFVIHGDRRYMDLYWQEIHETKSRDDALQRIMSMNLTPEEHQAARDGKQESDALINGEIWSMRLVSESIGIDETAMPADVAAFHLQPEQAKLTGEQKRDLAIEYIFGPEYSISKDTIRGNVIRFRNTMTNRYAASSMAALLNAERKTRRLGVGLILFFAFLIISIIFFVTQVISPLIAYSSELTHSQAGRLTILPEKGALEIRQFAGAFNALSSQVEQNTQRLARLGYMDYLTDVPNRAHITEFVFGLIRDRKHPVGLMIIDIDDFKLVNDTYGHAVGDRVLQQVAQVISSAQPDKNGISGRLCGEEFIAVLENANEPLLDRTGERILTNIRRIATRDVGIEEAPDFRISVSVGGTIWYGDSDVDFGSLLAQADQALYESKKNGKGRYTFYRS